MSPTKFIWSIGFLLFAGALLIGTVAFVTRPNHEPQIIVTAETVLDRITDRYVVVTKTAYISQSSEITVDQGSRWSNLLWGQTVSARGIVRVDIGVNLDQLTADDIIVSERDKTVTISVPSADIVSAAPYGDVTVESKQGVLKRILDNNPNSDYNRAVERLVADASTAVRQDPSLFDEARTDSLKILRLVVESLGYELIAK